MMYKVNKKYSRGPAVFVGQFVDMDDAKILINAKLEEDARLKVDVTYQLTDGMDVIEEFTQANLTSGASSQGQTSSVSFNPTPFNNAPRPAGLPHNWVKDEDNKDKK